MLRLKKNSSCRATPADGGYGASGSAGRAALSSSCPFPGPLHSSQSSISIQLFKPKYKLLFSVEVPALLARDNKFILRDKVNQEAQPPSLLLASLPAA